jgi:predicted enzyme related to lactoylglutathione lyase
VRDRWPPDGAVCYNVAMATLLGIGGVFVKSKDPKALAAWYREMFDIQIQPWGGATFPGQAGTSATWSPFAATTEYFKPSERELMVNFRVDDLDALLAQLRARGANVLDRREDGEFGKFGYVLDPDGTLLELWQP